MKTPAPRAPGLAGQTVAGLRRPTLEQARLGVAACCARIGALLAQTATEGIDPAACHLRRAATPVAWNRRHEGQFRQPGRFARGHGATLPKGQDTTFSPRCLRGMGLRNCDAKFFDAPSAPAPAAKKFRKTAHARGTKVASEALATVWHSGRIQASVPADPVFRSPARGQSGAVYSIGPRRH